jgi:hypothetical protein
MVYTLISKFTNYFPCIFPYKKKPNKRPPSLITNTTNADEPRDSRDPTIINPLDSAYDTNIPYEEFMEIIRTYMTYG